MKPTKHTPTPTRAFASAPTPTRAFASAPTPTRAFASTPTPTQAFTSTPTPTRAFASTPTIDRRVAIMPPRWFDAPAVLAVTRSGCEITTVTCFTHSVFDRTLLFYSFLFFLFSFSGLRKLFHTIRLTGLHRLSTR